MSFPTTNILHYPVAALAAVGRNGTRWLAGAVFVGMALQPLGPLVKPYLGAVVFVMLLFSYLRTDPVALARHMRSPGLVAAATSWVMIGTPLIFGTVYTLSGMPAQAPGLYQILILQIAIAPITSSAAFAALMGLDVALSLMTLIVASALCPITTVALSYYFLGASLLTPLELGTRLAFFFAASGAVAFIIRRSAGQKRIERQKEPIDGANVSVAFIFAIAAMEGVPRHFIADPLFALEILGLSLLVSGALIVISALVFIRAGAARGLVIGMLAGFRNIGLVMAIVGPALPDIAWFYFAMAQIPIYLLPMLLTPLARRFARKR